jgi:hypothetical protein
MPRNTDRHTVTCPDCGWYGLPVRSALGARSSRGRLPAVARCPECLAAIEVLAAPSVGAVERATGVVATTYRRMTVEAALVARVGETLGGAVSISLARDVHGVFVVRHSEQGSYRGATLLEALTALAGGAL